MQDTDRDHLADMLDHAEFAIQLLGSASTAAVASDRAKFSALCHEVQTIGEAASQLSDSARSDLSDIPWQNVIGMRHRIVHGYRTVAPEIVVATVRDDLPVLVKTLRHALEDETK
jgi:uncharacterized protein with HEPN domain